MVISKFPAIFFYDTKKTQLKFEYNLKNDYKIEWISSNKGLIRPISGTGKIVKFKTDKDLLVEGLISYVQSRLV